MPAADKVILITLPSSFFPLFILLSKFYTAMPSSLSSPSLLFILLFSACALHVHEAALDKNRTPEKGRMSPAEAEALFGIMESMSSDQNWRSSYPNPCGPSPSWTGIECKVGPDGLAHVSRLDFGCPPNPTCRPTATFPHRIFSLPFIQSAFFFECFTHTRTPLTVATNSSSLRQLSLRSNPALIGPIPPEISSFRSLEVLTLSQNSLSGVIPQQLFTLTSLVHLDLSYNKLSGSIPDQVGSLRSLVGLDLSYNSLSGIIPNTIGELGSLQKLDFSSNSLTGIIPGSVDRLGSLVFMALSNNHLTGELPPGIGELQSLQYFIMENNPMHTSLPSEIGLLTKLQELRLANCGFSGEIPASFSQLANLTTLSLQNNRLTGEIPTGFNQLSHIYHLNLSWNQLSGVVPLDASFLRRLGQNLDLSGNPGLCLSTGEAYGVVLCRTGKNGTLIAPLKSSGDSSAADEQLYLYSPLSLFSTPLTLPSILAFLNFSIISGIFS
ncbi:hypothetical protein SAY86_029759 [Trapa natans]|uniref:Leucine-rich repeat-containing N-terminal plant-type domain-containing protein n=1 Tax=Trapa natans TaxID=22666 RepID=A0AAN7RHN7_TRANT|nr:hypothetical protein SAY86_029759 [Trapa natans]